MLLGSTLNVEAVSSSKTLIPSDYTVSQSKSPWEWYYEIWCFMAVEI